LMMNGQTSIQKGGEVVLGNTMFWIKFLNEVHAKKTKPLVWHNIIASSKF
jgi:hypothetical protein